MKKNIITAILLTAFILPYTAKADEGMWLLAYLDKNYKDMKAKGLKLTPKQLYDVNQACTKDAIGWFGGGCTSEIISSKGLVLTNHHCGYSAIASLSSTSDNILDNGFWAKSMNEERSAKDISLAIVQRMDDITLFITSQLKGVAEKDRAAVLSKIYTRYQDSIGKGMDSMMYKNKTLQVRCFEFLKGNAYYAFVYKRFYDVRLVGTPPQSIGKFGGETDNWMWPRHTGDFSMFRIYSDSLNNPTSEFASTNKAYTPKSFLSVSMKGVKEGDFAMIMGFPGRTNRYEFAKGVKLASDEVDPVIVALRDIRLKAWKEEMNKSDDVRLKMSSTYAGIANYWKFFDGESLQLKKLKVYEYKTGQEVAFTKWAKGKPEYENLISDVNKAYEEYNPIALQRTFLNEGIMAPYLMQAAAAGYSLEENMKKNDMAASQKMVAAMMPGISELPMYPDIMRADKKIFAQILNKYYTTIPVAQQPALIKTILEKYQGNTSLESFEKYADDMYTNSVFSNKERTVAFLQNPVWDVIKDDIGYKHIAAFRENYNEKYKPLIDSFNMKNAALGRTYVKGMMEMNPNVNMYPDANSTIRLTYGQVQGYNDFPFMTDLDGVVAKHDQNNPEFMVPEKLLELHKNKDYGRYALKNGKLPVAFLTNNDITGGNSGSPVLDGNGNIIGLAFDGNWEAMSGNYVFDQKLKRTICVDIRYVLWNIDKLGNAPNIVDEMTLVN